MSRNVIANSDNGSMVSLWDLPIVSEGDQPTVVANAEILLPTAEDIEKIQQQAYKEAYETTLEKAKQDGFSQGLEEGKKRGFDEGKAEGVAKGIQEGQATIDEKDSQLAEIIASLVAPLEKLDTTVEKELVSLAMMVARHLVRRELKQDPSHVIAAVREAVELLPVATQKIHVFLHPDDASLVRESLSITDDDEQRWKIVEDPTLGRGGCKVETEFSRIDASIESRINRVIAHVLVGERVNDSVIESSNKT